MTARERARAVLDEGSFRELLGPFDRLESPWLPRQGIVPQSDDGVVIARGTFDGDRAVVAAIESAFQGGSMGEVSATKIACALDLARRDCNAGNTVRPILFLESGGVRLQEANLGLGAIAEIHAALVALRRLTPVVGVIAGPVGCFGGMSLAAALCTTLIVTREARLGMNGPEVIEQEAGITELDAADRRLVWSLIGGAQRHATGFADVLVDDHLPDVGRALREAFARGTPPRHRSADVDRYLARLHDLARTADGDAVASLTPDDLRAAWPREHTDDR
ncbi:biotin-independent malonate decarboxylase subunit beta [Chondromyces apiculatus]